MEIQYFLVLGLLMSQVNPERDKIWNFGENAFITQNLKFYRKQYMSNFSRFGSLTQLIRLILTILTTVIPCISITFEGSLQNLQFLLGRCINPDRQTLLVEACKQRNEAGFQPYLQRCVSLHSPSSQNPKLHNSGPDNEHKSTLDIAPHPQNLWEQHPIRTSATNLTARFNFEETGNRI